jgi:hypothetical protein
MSYDYDKFKEQIKLANPIEEVASQYTSLKKLGSKLVGLSSFLVKLDTARVVQSVISTTEVISIWFSDLKSYTRPGVATKTSLDLEVFST